MRTCAAAVLLALAFAATVKAQSFTVVTSPTNAQIHGLDKTGNRVLLGTGTAKVKLEKNAANRFWVTAEGFATLDTVFARDMKYPKSLTLTLQNRVIRVTALPYDATVRVNGQLAGSTNVDVVIPPAVPITVEVAKSGFKPETRVYRNEPGTELPIMERFELKDRQVNVQPKLPRNVQSNATPPTVSVDGTTIGSGNVDVVVPFDKCVTVEIATPGYKPEPRTLCNKTDRQMPEPVLPVNLVDRLVALTVTPQNAEIVVDNRTVGTGNYNLIVRDRGCVKAVAKLIGFASQEREYCNNDNIALDSESRIELAVDESFTSSVKSDQANVNFTIEVGASRSVDQAWSTISQAILSAFDVLEITDKETGYLRTSWEVSKFASAVIRTRVIVKLGDSQPLKYIVKIASERAEDPTASVKDDEKFQEWDRVMNAYKDLINELQARLR